MQNMSPTKPISSSTKFAKRRVHVVIQHITEEDVALNKLIDELILHKNFSAWARDAFIAHMRYLRTLDLENPNTIKALATKAKGLSCLTSAKDTASDKLTSTQKPGRQRTDDLTTQQTEVGQKTEGVTDQSTNIDTAPAVEITPTEADKEDTPTVTSDYSKYKGVFSPKTTE
jgi:hypothetical protein